MALTIFNLSESEQAEILRPHTFDGPNRSVRSIMDHWSCCSEYLDQAAEIIWQHIRKKNNTDIESKTNKYLSNITDITIRPISSGFVSIVYKLSG